MSSYARAMKPAYWMRYFLHSSALHTDKQTNML